MSRKYINELYNEMLWPQHIDDNHVEIFVEFNGSVPEYAYQNKYLFATNQTLLNQIVYVVNTMFNSNVGKKDIEQFRCAYIRVRVTDFGVRLYPADKVTTWDPYLMAPLRVSPHRLIDTFIKTQHRVINVHRRKIREVDNKVYKLLKLGELG